MNYELIYYRNKGTKNNEYLYLNIKYVENFIF